jgi:hypothetical protein
VSVQDIVKFVGEALGVIAIALKLYKEFRPTPKPPKKPRRPKAEKPLPKQKPAP